MITPNLIYNELAARGRNYSIVSLQLITTIDNKIELRKFTYNVLCKTSKIHNLKKITDSLSVDIISFIITMNNGTIPSFICPIAIPLLGIPKLKINKILKSKNINNKWKSILVRVDNMDSIDSFLN